MGQKVQKCADIIKGLSLKGHLISETICGLPTSSKKQTDEFDLFAFLLFTTNKSNQFVFWKKLDHKLLSRLSDL